MLNKKSVQNSESNYLSNALWNFQPKNEENGSQTSNNNSPSKNNPIENMDIETIKLDEKDNENDDYMNNIEQNKDLNEIKNEPIAFMEIESESKQIVVNLLLLKNFHQIQYQFLILNNLEIYLLKK